MGTSDPNYSSALQHQRKKLAEMYSASLDDWVVYDPRAIIPPEWDHESRHWLVGSFRLMKPYLQCHGLSIRETDHHGYIRFIDTPLEMAGARKRLAQGYEELRYTPKLTLHLMPDWEDLVNHPPHSRILGLPVVWEVLMGHAVYTHLEFGEEIDIATGFPAILKPKAPETSWATSINRDELAWPQPRVSALNLGASRALDYKVAAVIKGRFQINHKPTSIIKGVTG